MLLLIPPNSHASRFAFCPPIYFIVFIIFCVLLSFSDVSFSHLISSFIRCRNQQDNNPVSVSGNVSLQTIIMPAKYVSKTRMQCYVPPFIFDPNFAPNLTLNNYECISLDTLGHSSAANNGTLSYVRYCNPPPSLCMNRPSKGMEYFRILVIPCLLSDIASGTWNFIYSQMMVQYLALSFADFPYHVNC